MAQLKLTNLKVFLRNSSARLTSSAAISVKTQPMMRGEEEMQKLTRELRERLNSSKKFWFHTRKMLKLTGTGKNLKRKRTARSWLRISKFREELAKLSSKRKTGLSHNFKTTFLSKTRLTLT